MISLSRGYLPVFSYIDFKISDLRRIGSIALQDAKCPQLLSLRGTMPAQKSSYIMLWTQRRAFRLERTYLYKAIRIAN
jgi:hypothetical protein